MVRRHTRRLCEELKLSVFEEVTNVIQHTLQREDGRNKSGMDLETQMMTEKKLVSEIQSLVCEAAPE